ncbi:MAG: PTS sugar transporter subunit IIC [Deltaproteobacteria bacterium]|jgi:mannose/fructose/N-acetylgalactosamine-specific phosphotransferase system component IIC|nr:PTS sugar transporter subunit IIC [Deltaproteobacteria bacterium]
MDPLNSGFIAAVILGALLSLDRQSFGQTMLSRPLCVGLIVGWVLNEPISGLWLGLWTEILWLSRPPLGGFIAPNGGLAVSFGLLAWSLTKGFYPEAEDKSAIVLIFLAIPPIAALIAALEKLGRQRAALRASSLEKLLAAPQVDQLVEFLSHNLPAQQAERIHERVVEEHAQRPSSLFWANFQGLLVTLGASLFSLLFGSWLLAGLINLLLRLDPPWLWPILSQTQPFLLLVGLAINAGRFPKGQYVYLLLGLIVGLGAFYIL